MFSDCFVASDICRRTKRVGDSQGGARLLAPEGLRGLRRWNRIRAPRTRQHGGGALVTFPLLFSAAT